MKFRECELEQVKKRNSLFNLIEDFSNSGLKCAILEDWKYVSANVGARAINSAAVTYKRKHIKARIRNGNIYLINELI